MKANINIKDAVELVNSEIAAYEENLQFLLTNKENEPIMVEGETHTGYHCMMMVDPADVARVLLDFNYPTIHILEQEPPYDLWEELGRKFGLKTVSSFDL